MKAIDTKDRVIEVKLDEINPDIILALNETRGLLSLDLSDSKIPIEEYEKIVNLVKSNVGIINVKLFEEDLNKGFISTVTNITNSRKEKFSKELNKVSNTNPISLKLYNLWQDEIFKDIMIKYLARKNALDKKEKFLNISLN
jgi:hypothetical protein